jgi:benzodiazapine receptor
MKGRVSFAMLAALVALALIVGGAGSAFVSSSIDTWYADLAKPALTPPPAAFPIVWTTLYVLMGAAQWLVWRQGGFRAHPRAHLLYLAQLGLNLLWTYVFFGLRLPAMGFAELMLLVVFILLTLRAFRRVAPLAGWLLVPYMLWVSFAGYLNFEIVLLNP